MWDFWIDRGGTFTDLVGRAPEGTLHTHKLLSDAPDRYDDAAVAGIRALLDLEVDAVLPTDLIRSIRMGTTVATNALLERRGDRTVLAITAGLGDLLRIGFQNRPRLFDLDIVLPDLLHERVVEISERMGADGAVVTAVDEDAARRDLAAAYDDGIRAVAVALLHGHRFVEHEQRIAAIARDIGFTQVSVSHEVSPLSKLIARGDTTVVDAYLSPILRRYIDRVVAAVGEGTRLEFMQSSGGLTDARLFQGKDAILSGPAGGVVGMVEAGRQAGFEHLIGFDMGGTSTDVTHFDGELERTFETEVAGVRVRAPMLHVHTVAAGGGSILHFDGARFRVGPDSAGADPGPACYRGGGPLTVTDANVLLGRIRPEHFPSIFGPQGDASLDAEIVAQRFDTWAGKMRAATDDDRSGVQIAEGLLTIAVANMANAIKKISVMRGHDVTAYALHCFGGAGGQHACAVADELGMSTVLVHPFAGVLSAYGMGLADVRALRERQVDRPLDAQGIAVASGIAEELRADALEEMASQGIAAPETRTVARAMVRYAGSQQPIALDLSDTATMRLAFAAAHRSRFGFDAPSRQLDIEAVTVEAVATAPDVAVGRVGNRGTVAARSVPARERARMRSGGAWCDAALHHREVLEPSDVIEGPAIVVERTGTTIVDVGWQAAIDDERNLVITRVVARPARVAVGTNVDPVLLEVFNNLFMSIAEQMGGTLANTAYSVNIKERLDFSCAVFDAAGDLVANAPHVPVHLGSMGASVRTVIDRNADPDGTTTMRPGNAYVLNNPFDGGTHLPDVTVISPVFDEAGKTIQFYVGSRGHHADIGGRTPGSSPPDSTHIEEEGVVIDNVLLVEQGRFREREVRELLTSAAMPVRNVEQNIADLTAQIAANETGATAIRAMIRKFGIDVVHAYMQHVQDNAEESVRRLIDTLDDGAFVLPLDNGCEVRVAVRVDRATRTASFDFSGTSAQDPGNHNAPVSICNAAVLYVLRTLVGEDIPLNEGCLRAVEIIAPKGTIVNPSYPAAVVAGNTEISQAVTDAIYGALGVVAGSQATMNNLMYGNDRHQNYETICGGTGAGPTFDGASAVQSHMTNTRMTDPEILEQRLPVRVREMSIRRGSGGDGAHRGGDGAVRRLEFLEPMTVTIVSSSRRVAPFGVSGGEPGAVGENLLEHADGRVQILAGDVEVEVGPGDVVVMRTPGGGGFGSAS